MANSHFHPVKALLLCLENIRNTPKFWLIFFLAFLSKLLAFWKQIPNQVEFELLTKLNHIITKFRYQIFLLSEVKIKWVAQEFQSTGTQASTLKRTFPETLIPKVLGMLKYFAIR